MVKHPFKHLAQIARTVRRVPEVLVKVSGGGKTPTAARLSGFGGRLRCARPSQHQTGGMRLRNLQTGDRSGSEPDELSERQRAAGTFGGAPLRRHVPAQRG